MPVQHQVVINLVVVHIKLLDLIVTVWRSSGAMVNHHISGMSPRHADVEEGDCGRLSENVNGNEVQTHDEVLSRSGPDQFDG